MRKKVLSLVLAAAMVFGMTGCDSAISSESKSDSGDKSDTIKLEFCSVQQVIFQFQKRL